MRAVYIYIWVHAQSHFGIELLVVFETLQQQSQAEFESVFVLPYLLIRGKSRVIHMQEKKLVC